MQDLDIDGRHAAIPGGAGLVASDHRRGLAGSEQRFRPAEHQLHGLSGPPGQQGRDDGMERIPARAEITAHVRADDAHIGLVDGEVVGDRLRALDEGVIERCPDDDLAAFLAGERRLRFHGRVLADGHGIGPFDDDVRLGKSLVHVTLDDPLGRGHVAGMVENPGRAVGRRVSELHHRRQRLQLHLDLRQGRLGCLLADRGHRRQALAEKADLVVREDVDLRLAIGKVGCSGHVGGGDDRGDAGHRLRLARIDRQDARVMDGAAQDPGVQHAVHLQVGGVFRPAVHRAGAVQSRNADPDGAAGGRPGPLRRRVAAHQPGCLKHCVDDLHIAGAAAEVLRQAANDVGTARIVVGDQQGFGLHDHAGDAEPALRRACFEECLLQRMERRRLRGRIRGPRRQPLDGGDVPADGAAGRQQACLGRLAAHQDDAATAFPVVACLLRPGEVEVVAQNVQQGPGRSRSDVSPLPVDAEDDWPPVVRSHGGFSGSAPAIATRGNTRTVLAVRPGRASVHPSK